LSPKRVGKAFEWIWNGVIALDMGIADWTGLTESTGRYIDPAGYSSDSAFDNKIGIFQWPFFYEKGIIKHSYLVSEQKLGFFVQIKEDVPLSAGLTAGIH